jgi:hypothetical protein
MAETQAPPSYTDVELESYLPAGWALAAGEEHRWDDRRGELRVRVVDMCDLAWDLVVTGDEVGEVGRIPALKRAVERLDRKRFKSFL